MTTFTDGAPPSVTPEPDDGSVPHRAEAPDPDPDAGSAWLHDEIQRRIAEKAAAGGGWGAPGESPTGPIGGPDHTGPAASVRSRRRSSLACDICPPTGAGRGAPGPGVATECRGTYVELDDVGSPRRACRPPLPAEPSAMRRWISSRSHEEPGSGSAS